MEELPQDRWFWVWLTILGLLLGTAPFIYWQGYHWSGIGCAIIGLGGLFVLVRDRLIGPTKVVLKVAAVIMLLVLIGQAVGYDIINRQPLPPLGMWRILVLLFCICAAILLAILGAKISEKQSPPHPPIEKPNEPSKLVVHSATYGPVDNTSEPIDVGDVLRNAISGDSLVFDVQEYNFVIDGKNIVPKNFLPSKEKQLQVTFTYGNELPHTTERRKGGRLLLPEDSKIKWLWEEHQKLTKEVQRLTPSAPKIIKLSDRVVDEVATYPLKLRMHLRSDSTFTTDIQLQEYRPELVTLRAFPIEVFQIRLRDSWYPREHGVGHIALLPGQQFEAWIALDESKFNRAQVEGYRGRIGTLVLLVNGQNVEIKL
jgi:hypothetical protein